MAVAYIQEFPAGDRSTTNYDYVAAKVGDGPFDGLIAHTAGFDEDDGVFRILDIWESREHAQRFLDKHIQPLMEQGPVRVPESGHVRTALEGRFLRAAPRGQRGRDRRPGDLLVARRTSIPPG